MSGMYLDMYGEINNGAHRKAADMIGAPAFVWHQALWNPANSEKYEDRKHRKEKVEKFIHDLYLNLKAEEKKPFRVVAEVEILHHAALLGDDLSCLEVLHDDRVRVLTFKFQWNGVATKIRIENHTEYLAITSIIDASIDCSVAPLNKTELDSKFPVHSLISKYTNNFINGTYRGKDCCLPEFNDLNDTHNFIYKGIWEYLFDGILNINNNLQIKNGEIKTCGPLGPRFVDFRGFVTCEKYPTSVNDINCVEEKEGRNIDELGLQYNYIQDAFYKKGEGLRGLWQRNSYPNEDWARRRLDNAWRFLSLSGDINSSGLTGRVEFTVSRLLKGRILYASALAPQPRLPTKEPGLGQPLEPALEQPLLFYIHSVTQCERQIGRVVDRLCQLGTLRLATIIALPDLKSVPQHIVAIRTSIVNTSKKIHELVQYSRFDDPSNNKKVDNLETEILQGLDGIQKDIANVLNGTFQVQGTGNFRIGNASLDFRLLRSRYYRELFETLVNDLRISRIEGYQPYDAFVRRRLESAFKLIDGLDIRVSQMQAEWRSLDQLYLTVSVTALTRKIDRSQEKSTSIETEIKNINLWGEFWLAIALVPYYLTSMFHHFADCENENGWCQSWSFHGFKPIQIFASFALVVGFCFAVRASVKIIKAGKEEKRRKESVNSDQARDTSKVERAG